MQKYEARKIQEDERLQRRQELSLGVVESGSTEVMEDSLIDCIEEVVEHEENEVDEFGCSDIGEGESFSRNMTDIEKVALAAVRYNIGDRPAAAIATATCKSYGIVTE